MEKMISVVIPTYNRKNSISACVNSVLKQTYPNIEIIVVDDASVDETYELFENIEDERLFYYRYEINQGACFARNLGAEKAKGDYIAFQDSDDQWLPEKLEKQMAYLKKIDADFVFCGMNRIEPEASIYYPIVDFIEEKNAIEQLLTNNVISTQTMLMKRAVIEAIHFDTSFTRFQDWDFALQVALHGFKIGYLKEALVDSAVQANSISINVKTGMAYEHLYEKYRYYYNKYPHAKANILMYQARGYRELDYNKVRFYLRESLKAKKDLKTFIKLFLSCFGMWKN